MKFLELYNELLNLNLDEFYSNKIKQIFMKLSKLSYNLEQLENKNIITCFEAYNHTYYNVHDALTLFEDILIILFLNQNKIKNYNEIYQKCKKIYDEIESSL